MPLTLTELQDKLKNIDEVSLMEVLEISSEDLVNRFVDRIEERMEYLGTEFDDGLGDDYDEVGGQLGWSEDGSDNE